MSHFLTVMALVAAALSVTEARIPEPPSAAPPSVESRKRTASVVGVAAHLHALDRIPRIHGGTRAAGTPGDRATADYVAERLRRAGYEVSRQRVHVPYFRTLGTSRVMRASGPLPGGRRAVRPLDFTRGGSVRGRVRRIGKGCTAAKTATLRPGEVALVRRGGCTFLQKGRIAARAGAAAILIGDRQRQRVVSGTLGRPGLRIPALILAQEAAAVLRTGEPVRVEVRTLSEMRVSENVLSETPGPSHRRSLIVGAHLDSVPEGPGLNDNGSGVAAALDVAERLAARRAAPRRVRFAFWAAEELGLVGSRHFVRALDRAGRRSVLAYPVCRQQDREAVAAALRNLIAAPDSPAVLLAERTRADERWEELLHGRHIRHESFQLIDLEGLDWEGWLATKSASFRQQARRGERRLEHDHRVEHRLVTEEDEVLDALDTLIRLHDARWNGASTAFGRKRRAFHETFAVAAARRGWLQILLTTLNGEPAAARLGYRYGGAESSYLIGRAPQRSKHNVGSALRMHAIREAADHVKELRLLLGAESHKQRLATADPGLDTFLVAHGVLPRLGHAVIRHRRRLPAATRRPVAARLGW